MSRVQAVRPFVPRPTGDGTAAAIRTRSRRDEARAAAALGYSPAARRQVSAAPSSPPLPPVNDARRQLVEAEAARTRTGVLDAQSTC